jgi:hypothetical protein
MPVCEANSGESQRSNIDGRDQQNVDDQNVMIGNRIMNQNRDIEQLVLNNKEKNRDDIFFAELVTFISRHFIDDRIANPDLKEIYLVRMNVLLQHN